MRHHSLCRMVIGAIVVSLAYSSSPVWAGSVEGSSSERQIGTFDPVEVPAGAPSTQGAGAVLWDNGDFDGGAVSSQCDDPAETQNDCTLSCDNFGTSADDFKIDAGSIVKGVDCTFVTFNPAGGRPNEIFGWVVTFYGGTLDTGGEPGDPIPDVNFIKDCFVTTVDGEVFDRGGGTIDYAIEFEGGDAHVSDGEPTWVSVVPVSETGPQTGFGLTNGRRINEAALRFTGLDPDFHNLSDPIFDITGTGGFAFKLRGEPPNGGSRVVTLEIPAQGLGGGCTIRITPTLPTETDCASGDCPEEFPGCFGETVAVGSPSQIAFLLAADMNFRCGPEFVSATSVGPRLIVNTVPGESRPVLCLSINDQAQGVLGGSNDCKHNACGLFLQVGDNEVLPPIAAGSDNFATTKDCLSNVVPLDLPVGFFDRSNDDPPSKPFLEDVGLTGVAVAFNTDDHDTTVRRLEDAVFGECSCDFSRQDGDLGVFSPDGLCDENDIDKFRDCQLNGGPDCSFFDYDGDGNITGDVDEPLPTQIDGDAAVLRCLESSGDNNPECCPGNLTLPQTSSTSVLTEINRLHLRSCDYLNVQRTGLNDWPEKWVLDVRLSTQDPQVGGGVKPDCEDGWPLGEPNDVIATALDLGLLTADLPRRVPGEIGDSELCDCDGFAEDGECDGDAYRFTLAFRDTVVIDVNAQVGRDTDCSGVEQSACASIFVYNSNGILVTSNDGGMDADQGCLCEGDPSVSPTLDPGEYFVLVQGADPVAIPDPTQPVCSVTEVPTDFQCVQQIQGLYELNVAIADKSFIDITRTNELSPGKFAGTFNTTLLVQPLLAFWQVCNPRHAILLDTGVAGEDAVVLSASGDFVEDLDPALGVIPGDPGFVPGVRDDNGSQSTSETCHENPGGDHLHCVEPPVPPKTDCAELLADCGIVLHRPDPAGTRFGAAVNQSQDFPAADDFTIEAPTDIRSLTVWLTPAGAVQTDYIFPVRILGDTVLGVCDSAPDENNVLGGGQEGIIKIVGTDPSLDADRVTIKLANPALNLQPGTYWVEFVWDSDASGPGSQPFFMRSQDGNDMFFRDLTPAARDTAKDPDNCPASTADGDGWDCDPFEDDPKTEDCDESDPDGDRWTGTGDVAFCLGSNEFEPTKRKDIPWDIACGRWQQEAGRIVWIQPQSLTGNNAGFIGVASDVAANFRAADNFIFFENTELTDVHWTGFYIPRQPVPDSFFVVIQGSDGDLPGTVIIVQTPVVQRMRGGFTGTPGRHLFEYWAELDPPFIAQADTMYWLTVQNDTSLFSSQWDWSVAVDGYGDDRSASSPDDDVQWSVGGVGGDLSFSLTTELDTATRKIICGDSVDCGEMSASGLGYRFDPEFAMINGFQTKEDSPPDVFNRWRAVDAPFKFFNEFSEDVPVAWDSPEGQALLRAANISTDEEVCLVAGIGQKLIVATFNGVAAYDMSAEENGHDVSGAIELLCNGAVYQIDAAGDLLDQKLEAKGICWTNGLATFQVHEFVVPQVPICIVHGNPDWVREDPLTHVSWYDWAFSKYIDPKVESSDGVNFDKGIGPPFVQNFTAPITVVFNIEPFGDAGGVNAPTTANVSVEVTGGAVPNVVSVTKNGNALTVELDRIITLQEWTTLVFDVWNADGVQIDDGGNEGEGVFECARLDVGFLPGDVNNSSATQPLDLSRWIVAWNAGRVHPSDVSKGIAADYTDISRNDLIQPADLSREIAALKGQAPFTQNWRSVSMNNTQP